LSIIAVLENLSTVLSSFTPIGSPDGFARFVFNVLRTALSSHCANMLNVPVREINKVIIILFIFQIFCLFNIYKGFKLIELITLRYKYIVLYITMQYIVLLYIDL